MGVRVSRPSCRDPHVLLDVNVLPDKHTSYKIMAQKKQGHRPAKNPRSGLLLTEELLQ